MTAIPSNITTIAGLARHRLASMSTEELVAGPHELDTRRLAGISSAIAAASAEQTRPVAVLIDLDPDGYLLILAALASGRPILSAFALRANSVSTANIWFGLIVPSPQMTLKNRRCRLRLTSSCVRSMRSPK